MRTKVVAAIAVIIVWSMLGLMVVTHSTHIPITKHCKIINTEEVQRFDPVTSTNTTINHYFTECGDFYSSQKLTNSITVQTYESKTTTKH